MKCLDYDLDYEQYMVYEKLVLLYLFLEDFDLVILYFSKINEKELNSYHLLKKLLKHNNDFTHDDVISELENCFNEEIIKHHGRGMLFGTLLYQAYRKTYQYPKAIKVMESLNFNQKSLWTKNFTIIFMGSILSALGGIGLNVALGVMIFDNTQSTFLSSLYIALTSIPTLVLLYF